MDFTATISDVCWGKGYEAGFRAGWEAHAAMFGEVNGEPAVDSDFSDSVPSDFQRTTLR